MSISVASSFSIQKVSRHHYLIRGDPNIKMYMDYCGVKWSSKYDGWLAHENDEIDFVQMHLEVLEALKDKHTKPKRLQRTQKKGGVAAKKKQKTIMELEDDDEEDDEYVPGESDEDDEDDDDDDDEDDDDDDDDDEDDDDDDDEDDDEDSAEKENAKKKKEYLFYKKGILAFGPMTINQQHKLDAVWNKYLKGWICPKSSLSKLQKMHWTEKVEAVTVATAAAVPEKKRKKDVAEEQEQKQEDVPPKKKQKTSVEMRIVDSGKLK